MSRLSLSAIAVAAELSTSRVENWLRCKQFVALDPSTRAVTKARDWTPDDLFRLIAMVRLVDAGAPAEIGRAIPRLHTFKGRRAFLVAQAFGEELVKSGGVPAGTRFSVDVRTDDEIVEAISTPFDPLALYVVDLDVVSEEVDRVLHLVRRLPEAADA